MGNRERLSPTGSAGGAHAAQPIETSPIRTIPARRFSRSNDPARAAGTSCPDPPPLPPASGMPDQVLVDAALLLASELGRLSTSMLQVKLKIGFTLED